MLNIALYLKGYAYVFTQIDLQWPSELNVLCHRVIYDRGPCLYWTTEVVRALPVPAQLASVWPLYLHVLSGRMSVTGGLTIMVPAPFKE